MSKKAQVINTTVATIVGLGLAVASTSAVAATAKQEKCYGVVLAGKNDCGTAQHACAGNAKKDKDPNEWLYMPQGLCERIGGTVK